MSLLNMLTRRTRGRSSLVDLYAPGASEGDVLTVGADGSLSPAAPGGGGSQPAFVGCVLGLTGGIDGYSSNDVIAYNRVDADSDSYYHADGTNILIPAGKAGLYLVTYTLAASELDFGTQSHFQGQAFCSGNADTLVAPFAQTGTTNGNGAASFIQEYAEGDAVTGVLDWDGGGTARIAHYGNLLCVQWLGPAS